MESTPALQQSAQVRAQKNFMRLCISIEIYDALRRPSIITANVPNKALNRSKFNLRSLSGYLNEAMPGGTIVCTFERIPLEGLPQI